MISLKDQRLLIIAPHPDDEVIGCAGLIQKIKQNKGEVYVLFLTVGDTNDFTKKGLSTLSSRKKEIEKIASFLHFDKYDIAFEGSQFHLQLDLLGQKKLMQVIERDSSVSIEKIRPTIIAFPTVTSYNQDHRIAAHATFAALRPAEKDNKHFVPTVLCYEEAADTWSLESQPSPNIFVPLSEKQMKAKLKALKLYKSQYRKAPNPRSQEVLQSLAVLRGAQAGVGFAEGFISFRNIL